MLLSVLKINDRKAMKTEEDYPNLVDRVRVNKEKLGNDYIENHRMFNFIKSWPSACNILIWHNILQQSCAKLNMLNTPRHAVLLKLLAKLRFPAAIQSVLKCAS